MKKMLRLVIACLLVFGSMAVSQESFACASNAILDEIVQLAEEGKVNGSPFIVGTEIQSIHQKWGVPNAKVEDDIFMGKLYDFYTDKKVGYKADATNTKIKSLLFKPGSGVLNLPQVEEYMGSPDSGSVFSVSYHVGEYILTFFYHSHRVSEFMFIESIVVSKID